MKDRKERPWWETQLPQLSAEMRNYLGKRVPTMKGEHDDLVNEALSDLASVIQRRPSMFPGSWSASGPPREEEQAHLRRLAMRILRRRVSDLFREQARRWARSTDVENLLNVSDPHAPTAERRLMLANALRITLGVLANWSLPDRELFSMGSIGPNRRIKALTARERHRIRKLREELRAEIVSALGASVTEILRT